MPSRALLIVEPDFLNVHVGIRRISLYFWARLLDRGYDVSVATAGKDGLRLRETPPLAALEREIAAAEERNDEPAWTSGQPWTIGPDQQRDRRTLELPVAGTSPLIDLGGFDVSLVANPWLCVNGLPPGPVTVGVVADMVPNLLALGALRMDAFLDVYPFARAHDVGYRLYLERAARICCISESTRDDFRLVYRLDRMDQRPVVCIPYAHDPAREASPPRNRPQTPRILLVNVLDHRKNFSTIGRALASIARGTPCELDVVGRERIPLADASRFLQDLAALGLPVRWFRGASDACLQRLYAEADVLLFPSIYEGLGLPVLEAQSVGTPVVSSDSSSSVEINRNVSLAVNPRDPGALVQKTLDVLLGRTDILRGTALQHACERYLSARNSIDVFLPGSDCAAKAS